MKKMLLVLLAICFLSGSAFAQFYLGANLGLKSSGLEGAIKISQNGQVQTGNVADAGATGFTAGVSAGYQVIPPDVADGLYKLDLNLDISWSSFDFLEEGYNSVAGSGSFNSNGLSDGSTNIFSFDIMPMHRMNFDNFILSPFAGLGLSLNLLMTSDVKTGPPSGIGKITGVSEMQVGLLVFYGTIFNIEGPLKPYVQFKHVVPFGDETQFTETFESAQGFGSQNIAFYISDVPGFFSLTAGVRYNL